MRILHIVNDAETGGAQTLIEAMCRSRVPGDEHHILVLLGPGALSGRLGGAANSIHHAGLRRRDVLPFRAIAQVRRLVDALGIDVIHSHLLQSDLVAILSRPGVPLLSTLHTSGAHESRPLAKLVGFAVARLSRRLNKVVACSASARDYALAANYADGSRIEIIHNGTAVPPRYPAPAAPSPSAPMRLVQLARWHPMKDHRNLFAAVALLQEWGHGVQVHCAGAGMDTGNTQLASLIQETGVSSAVHLHGSVKDVQSLFAGTSALVISSSHGEALPMAGLEALAAGLPVLTTRVGDCPQLVVDPGLLVPPSDPTALAAAIAALHDAPTRRWGELSYLAWKRALDGFEEGATARAYRRRYDMLLESSETRAPARHRA